MSVKKDFHNLAAKVAIISDITLIISSLFDFIKDSLGFYTDSVDDHIV